MKRMTLLLAVLLTAFNVIAQTPASSLVEQYKEEKGARNFVARGILMRVARQMMKEYTIAPLAHKVEAVSVLRMDKASDSVKLRFQNDLHKVLSTYMYAGKSQTNRGVIDAYVHLASPHVADELIVYNPKIKALYSLTGTFTEEELLKIQNPVE